MFLTTKVFFILTLAFPVGAKIKKSFGLIFSFSIKPSIKILRTSVFPVPALPVNTANLLEKCIDIDKSISLSNWEKFLELGQKGYSLEKSDPLYPGMVKIDNIDHLIESGRAIPLENNSRADLVLDGIPGSLFRDSSDANTFFIPDEQFIEKGLPLDFSNFKNLDLTDHIKSNVEASSIHPEIRDDLLRVNDLGDLDALRSSYADSINRASEHIHNSSLELSDVGLLDFDMAKKSEGVRFIDSVYESHIEKNSLNLDEWNTALRMGGGNKMIAESGYIAIDLKDIHTLDSPRLHVSEDGAMSLDGMRCVSSTEKRVYFDLNSKTYFDLVNLRVVENYGLDQALSNEGSLVLDNFRLDYLKENGLLEVTEKNFYDGLDRCSLNGKDVILDTCYESDGNFTLYDENYFIENLYPEFQNPESMENECPFDVDEGIGLD